MTDAAPPSAIGDIERLLDDGSTALLDDAIEAFRFDEAPVASERTRAICDRLQNQRRFGQLLRFADAALQRGASEDHWGDVVQALLDQGAHRSAEAALEMALRSVADERVVTDLQGRLGRINKERFLATNDPKHLEAAIGAYAAGLRVGGDALWLGINAHALQHLGRRRGFVVEADGLGDAAALFAEAEKHGRDGHPWGIATMVEASLLIGLPVPVDAIVHGLADAPPFVVGSLMRQLNDVWELPADHPAIVTLAELSLRSGGPTEVVLPSDDAGYEKMFGTEWPIPIETYREGIRVAESVCHLLLGERFPVGTGFIIDGAELHPAFAGRAAVLTNEHVVPSPGRDGVRAEELVARFETSGTTNLNDLEAVWWSDREDLDVTVLLSAQLDASSLQSLAPTPRLPVVRSGAYVYVVGHPGGGGLQLSVRGNDLIDQDGTRLHYRAPTSKGSSGSPVFDHEWRLIGIHHFGSPTLPALNQRSGTYDGNQGTTINAVRERLTERPPST